MPKERRKVFSLSFTVVFIWGLLLFVILFGCQGVSPAAFFARLTKILYIPSHNICVVGNMGHFHAYFYFYLLLGASFITIGFLRIKLKLEHIPLYRFLFTVALAVYFLLIGFQSLNQLKVFVAQWQAFAGKTLAEKNQAILGKTYKFAQLCREAWPGYHRAELVTDLDMSRDPGMYMHRAVAYHLYPIDIRAIHREGLSETIVLFYKKNARAFVPDDFEIIAALDDENVLAVKKRTMSK